MTSPKYTPGPWVIKPTHHHLMLQVHSKDDCIATCDTGGFDLSYDEREANARLIAQAPALYAEYGKLHDMVSDMLDEGRLTEADIPDDYQALIAQLGRCCDVMAKVEGD